MSYFLGTFFLIYAACHAYFFAKARAAFRFGLLPGCGLALFLGLMVMAPVMVRNAEKHGLDLLAHLLAWSGYLWMGFLFYFFATSLLVDGYHAAVRVAGHFAGRDITGISLAARTAFAVPASLSFLICCYGFYEALHIRTERVVIKTSKLSPAMGRLRIAQVSDVHLGLIVRQARLSRMLAAVRQAEPDIFVATGDLVDGQINGLEGLAELLDEVRPRLGKFAILGNHEYYAGLSETLAFTRRAGFTILRGEAVQAGPITIAGVDDVAGKRFGHYHDVTDRALLAPLSRERFTLLLKHRPALERDALGLFDLQLSGHVHKGQLFPFNLVTYLFYPVRAGLSPLPGGSSLYVSRGTGTWGAPIRFLAPPEVTVIDLVPADSP